MESFCPKCGWEKTEEDLGATGDGYIIQLETCARCDYIGIFAIPLRH